MRSRGVASFVGSATEKGSIICTNITLMRGETPDTISVLWYFLLWYKGDGMNHPTGAMPSPQHYHDETRHHQEENPRDVSTDEPPPVAHHHATTLDEEIDACLVSMIEIDQGTKCGG